MSDFPLNPIWDALTTELGDPLTGRPSAAAAREQRIAAERALRKAARPRGGRR